SAVQRLKLLLEKEEAAAAQLHPRHLVLCRLHRRIAFTARAALAAPQQLSISSAGVLSEAKVAEVLVRAALEVRLTQALYLPATHLQAAEAAEDLATGIAVLLGRDRQRLFVGFREAFPDFSSASAAESALRREAADVRALYCAGGAEKQKKMPSDAGSIKGEKPTPEVAERQQPTDWAIFD
ncbi:unnamed protein product, partial [Polarella glacialis]